MINKNEKYRADIDGLRAIAVTVVIFFHANILGFSGGFVGVDVFFVISGYLITKHLTLEICESQNLSFVRFYAKRFKRLLPAILFLCVSILILWCFYFWNLTDESTKFFKSLRYSAWGTANIYFKNVSQGYFSGASDEMPLLHFWSLAVEEQFYLVWPIVLYLLGKYNYKEHFIKHAKLTVEVIIFISFTIALALIYFERKDAAFYYMPARAWELGLGAWLVFIKPRKHSLFLLNFIGGIGLIFIFASIALAHYWIFPGVGALLPTIGTFLLIFSGEDSQTKISKFLGNKFFVFIGGISYGWYLWHWPFLAMLKIYHLGENVSLSLRVGAIILSAFFAYFSLIVIEKPIRFSKKPYLNGKNVILLSLLAILLISITPSILSYFQNKNLKNNSLLLKIQKRTALLDACVDKEKNMGEKECIYKNNTLINKYRIHVWGDSFSYAYFPMFENYIDKMGGSASLYSNSGIPPLLQVPGLFFGTEENSKKKIRISNLVIEKIAESRMKEPMLKHSVVLVAYWLRYMPVKHIRKIQDTGCIEKQCRAENTVIVMKDSLISTITKLNSLGLMNILIIKPWVEFKYPIERCIAINESLCDTKRSDMKDYAKEVTAVLEEIAKKFTNVHLVDPLKYICNDEVCGQVIEVEGGKIPVVFDDAHPSVDAAKFFSNKIVNEINWLVE